MGFTLRSSSKEPKKHSFKAGGMRGARDHQLVRRLSGTGQRSQAAGPRGHSLLASFCHLMGQWVPLPLQQEEVSPKGQDSDLPPPPYGFKSLSGSLRLSTIFHHVSANEQLFGLSFPIRPGTPPEKSKTPACERQAKQGMHTNWGVFLNFLK